MPAVLSTNTATELIQFCIVHQSGHGLAVQGGLSDEWMVRRGGVVSGGGVVDYIATI